MEKIRKRKLAKRWEVEKEKCITFFEIRETHKTAKKAHAGPAAA